MIVSSPKAPSGVKALRIGDSQDVWAVYEEEFRDLQQTAYKILAKAWIKVIEPKKRDLLHPYVRGNSARPPLWPWSDERGQQVIHIEPDYMTRYDRVRLLCCIIRLVVEPRVHQEPQIRERGLDVAALKETAFQSLSIFFDASSENSWRQKFLDEILAVAKMEDALEEGGNDPSSIVLVMADDFDEEEAIGLASDSSDI